MEGEKKLIKQGTTEDYLIKLDIFVRKNFSKA